MNEVLLADMLLKIAIAIDKEYGCAGCPYEERCEARTDTQCIGRIVIWLESVIE